MKAIGFPSWKTAYRRLFGYSFGVLYPQAFHGPRLTLPAWNAGVLSRSICSLELRYPFHHFHLFVDFPFQNRRRWHTQVLGIVLKAVRQAASTNPKLSLSFFLLKQHLHLLYYLFHWMPESETCTSSWTPVFLSPHPISMIIYTVILLFSPLGLFLSIPAATALTYGTPGLFKCVNSFNPHSHIWGL